MIKEYHDQESKKTKVLWEKEEREKHLALWAGVCFFMILIIFLWFLNTKNFFDSLKFRDRNNVDFDKVSGELNQTLEEVMSKVGELRDVDRGQINQIFTAPAASSSASSSQDNL